MIPERRHVRHVRKLPYTSWPHSQMSTDGRVLLHTNAEGTLSLMELATGRERSRIPYHEGRVALSPDGRFLAVGGEDYAIRLWDIEAARELGRFQGHRGAISALAFALDGRQLVSCSHDYTALVWDVRHLLTPR